MGSVFVFIGMAINRYLPFAFLYFFFNSLGLPFGLTYTVLLAPFFYWWVLTTRRKETLLPFLIVMFPIVFIQVFFVGVNDRVYFVSFLNLTATYIFCQAFYTFLKKCRTTELVLTRILVVNFILCIVAIVVYFTSLKGLFWASQPLTKDIHDFERLKLFTYEPSYYAMLFVPVFFFFLLQIIFYQNARKSWQLFLMVVLPLVLSFSLGVMVVIALSLFAVFVVYFRRLVKNRRVVTALFILATVIVPVIAIWLVFFPGNTLFVRLENIVAGYDTSGKGRTYEAFYLSQKILALKSDLWGIGLGQVKVIGTNVIKDYYLYTVDYKSVAIPNATAETLAIFGFMGLMARLVIEIGLFFYTKVWKNYYRLLLFLFVFVYQFTGSFITNVAEYIIWILAFTNVFRQFDVQGREEPRFLLDQ
jgi:hypothetical protein